MDPTEALVRLGDTPEVIAASLYKLGIRGKRLDGCDCPLAKYLGTVCDVDAVEVESSRVTVTTGFYNDGEPDTSWVPTSAAVAGFVMMFDDGFFPELVAA